MDKFFGTTVTAGKDVTVDIPAGHILRITQLAISDSAHKVSLIALVEGNSFTVATLNGGAKIFQVNTSLVFSPDQTPKLQAKGNGTIHVTGTMTNTGDTHIDDEDDMSDDDDDEAPRGKGGVRASDLSDDDSLTPSQIAMLEEDGGLGDFDMDDEEDDDLDEADSDDESLDEDAAGAMKDLASAKKDKSLSPKQSPKQSPKLEAAASPKAAAATTSPQKSSPQQSPKMSPAAAKALQKLEAGTDFADLADSELEALDEAGLLPDMDEGMLPEDFDEEDMEGLDGLDDEDDFDDLDDASESDVPPPAAAKSQSPKTQQQGGSPRGSVGTGVSPKNNNNNNNNQNNSAGRNSNTNNSAQRPSFGGRGGGNNNSSPGGAGRGGGNFSPNRGRGFGSPRGSR